MSIQQEKFKAIADRIRLYLGNDDLIKPNDFADKVDEAVNNQALIAYKSGKSDGIEQQQPIIDGYLADFDEIKETVNLVAGIFIENDTPTNDYAEKINDRIEFENSIGVGIGIEQGKQAQYDEFWDAYQKYNGDISTIYSAQYLFGGSGWDDNTFKPKHSMGGGSTLTNASSMFQMCSITNVTKILEEQGVTFNFTNATNFSSIMAYSKITHFPDVITTSAGGLTNFLNQAYNLESIGLITLRNDGIQTFANAFYNCPKLKDISFAGVIGNDISFSDSPLLSKASITSIIEHLSTTATGKTLTLNKTAKEATFTAEEWATLTATKTNWTISLV